MKTKKVSSRCGNLFCFHGAFNLKSEATAKAAKRKGAKIKSVRIGGGYRYLVMTPKG